MRYVLLLRGVNVGGKNRVVMTELKEQLCGLGYREADSYINSGNLFFSSKESEARIKEEIKALLVEHYAFDIPFALISAEKYREDAKNLPAWWREEMQKKDVLFYTEEADAESLRAAVRQARLGEEKLHFGEIALYWGRYGEKNPSGTPFARYLLRQPVYKKLTIRNGNTFEKMGENL